MEQVTQQNAAMVQESTAASHGLARDADELTRLIGRFKLGPTAARRPGTVTGLQVVGRGGAAKPAPAEAAPDWLEF